MKTKKIQQLITDLLKELSVNSQRKELQKTPERVAHMLEFLTSGNRMTLKEIAQGSIFPQEMNSMIVLKDIELYSMCEHHLLPFFGKCHIGYIPNGNVLGVSTIAKIIDMYARRLQMQERMTEQIAQAIMDVAKPMGVGVVIECKHLCMMMRGVEKQNAIMTTSSVLGTFRTSVRTRQEFLSHIHRKDIHD